MRTACAPRARAAIKSTTKATYFRALNMIGPQGASRVGSPTAKRYLRAAVPSMPRRSLLRLEELVAQPEMGPQLPVDTAEELGLVRVGQRNECRRLIRESLRERRRAHQPILALRLLFFEHVLHLEVDAATIRSIA